MAVSIVQSQMAPTVMQPFNNASANGAFPSRCTGGNTIVVLIGGGTINSGQTWSVSAVTDDDLNTYTIISGAFRRLGGSPPNDSGVFDEGVMIAVATNIAATPVAHTNSVTISFGTTTQYGSGGIYELSPCTFDQALAASATGSSAVSVGPLTPAANGAFIVGVTQHDFNGSTGGMGVPQAGWTQDMNTGMGGFAQASSRIIQTTAAALSYKETPAGTGAWVASFITLVPAGGGGPVALTPAASAVTQATAAVTALSKLSPTAAAVTQATAVVTAVSGAALSPVASAVTAATATLTATAKLTASAATVTQATATLTAPAKLTASALAVSAATATMAPAFVPVASAITAATATVSVGNVPILAPVASAVTAATTTISVGGPQRLTPTANVATTATLAVIVPIGLVLSAAVATAATGLVGLPAIVTTPIPGSGEPPIFTTLIPGSTEPPITTIPVPGSAEGPITTTARL